ncbi:MAG: metal-dependent transcriptional regulator [Candidatus Omnitrophota bacterium]|nr:metal-dependent transcriptional regulator [Candidatus Omnitrophota bacterium]
MELSERAEEVLEALWIQKEEEGKKPLDLGIVRDDPAQKELLSLGYIKIEAGHIILLEKGKKEAEAAIRRHRLAERLLTDVLDIKQKLIDEVSCRFEHLLHKGVEENVCTLLGHPKICPHGKPIPPGNCCKVFEKKAAALVVVLTEMQPGQKGKIAYLNTKDHEKLNKLLAMGALPGVAISLIQKFPSYVFQISSTQFAIDSEIAKQIFVRLSR